MQILIAVARASTKFPAFNALRKAYDRYLLSNGIAGRRAMNDYRGVEGFLYGEHLRENKGRPKSGSKYVDMHKGTWKAMSFRLPSSQKVWRYDESGQFHNADVGSTVKPGRPISLTFDIRTALGFNDKDPTQIYLCDVSLAKGTRVGMPQDELEVEVVTRRDTKFKVLGKDTHTERGVTYHIVRLVSVP